MSSKSNRLGSLADVFQSEVLEGTIRKIKIEKIIPSEIQPRSDRLKGVEELAKSLKEEGLLQPIIVTKEEGKDNYTIIAGERRFHAAKSLGWNMIECKILNKNQKETYKLAVIENLQRENLSPYEEIEAIFFLKKDNNYTDQELGNIFGKSRNYMTEIMSIASMEKDQINKCKTIGINSKNLLIQAVQALKRGDFEKFLDKYSKGEFKTVKEAKEFNKTISKNKLNKEADLPLSNLYTIQKIDSKIIIKSTSKELLNKIHTIIKKELSIQLDNH